MNAARGEVSQETVMGNSRPLPTWPRMLLGLLLAAAVALPGATALAQDGGGGGIPMPKFILGGEHKRKLTPEEEEQQKRIDADYKAATRKIPDQKSADPWADVRQAPGSGQKASTSTQNGSAQKKKQSAQQAQ